MAGNNKKVFCPKCGAESSTEGFGTEQNRVTSARTMPHSDNPTVTARRQRAAELRRKQAR